MNSKVFSADYSELAQRLDGDVNARAWAVHERALELQRQGDDVVLLSIGDPDFRTPDPIIDNAVSHMRVGRTHYSPALGELNLRRAVADYETRVSPFACSADNVAIFPGVTNAIYSVLACLLNPGDGVVIVEPQYVGYPPITNGLQLDVQLATAKSENAFVPTFDDIVGSINDNTRLVFLNTPANPTGAIIKKSTLRAVADHCLQRNIWLLCDEVYSMFTYEKQHVSLRSAAECLDNVIVIDGLSKSHAMSGWRMGWAVAPKSLIHHLGNFSTMSMFGCPQFIQDAAAFALNNDEYYVKEMCDRYAKRRDAVCKRLDAIAGLGYLRPEAGMFVMVDVRKHCEDDTEFAAKLLDAQGVSVLPGSAFGQATAGHVRLSLVQTMDVLMDGCSRLQRFCTANP